MIEKLKLIYRILKGEIVTLSEFHNEVMKCAFKYGSKTEFYVVVSVKKSSYPFIVGAVTEYCCHIQGFDEYIPTFSTPDELVKFINKKTDANIKYKKEQEFLTN